MTRLLSLLACVALLGACADAPTAPKAPLTLAEARKRLDDAVLAVYWAQLDTWALGARDVVVSVQLDSSLAPHYFRLERKVGP